MGGLFGSSSSSSTPTPLAGVTIQSSANGLPIPLVYGTTRVAPNLIWYGDFKAIPQSSSAGGKGGGSSPTTGYSYKASFAFGICEGPVTGITNAWIDKTQEDPDTLFSLFLGTYPQAAWSYLTSNHPSEAIGYPGIAYAGSASYDLGTSANLPNHNFEVQGRCLLGGGVVDADPADIIEDLLTNELTGVPNAPTVFDLTQYSAYCRASGILLSPAYSEQTAAATMLSELFQITNTGGYFSENALKIVPYGDATVTGNGVTYTPDLTIVADLGDDDFLADANEDPVKVARNAVASTANTSSDACNQVSLEYLNRDNDYTAETVTVQDQVSIDTYGLRPMSTITAHQIADSTVAGIVADLILQRSVYVRGQYTFRLGWAWCYLEPTDLVTITDSVMGLNQYPVRILTIEEDDQGTLTVTAEDAPPGVSSHVVAPVPQGGGYSADYNAAPGKVVDPAFFERRNADALKVGIAVTGQSDLWGGCQIWSSIDGATYKYMASTHGGARYGTLLQNLGATGISLSAQLTGLGGEMLSATQEEADLFLTECCIGGEMVAYQTATLTAANRYTLDGLRRGGFGSSAEDHAAGSSFIRVDEAIVDSDALDAAMIGKTIWFKFVSFNVYGGGYEDLSEVTAYPYTITGVGATTEIGNVAVTETLVVAAGAVVTKAHIEWAASSSFKYASVAWRLNGGSWTTLPDIYGTSADLILSDSGRLELAITPYASAAGQTIYATATIAGKTTAPANVSGLAINLSGRQALLTWNPATDLDVLVGGWMWLRYSPVVSGASWGNACDLLTSVPGAATSATVPLLDGCYLARWVDSSGNLSRTAATLVVDAAVISTLNVIVSQEEAPSWSGSKNNMSINSGTLQLSNPTQAGSYRAAIVDLGDVHPARLSAAVQFSGFVANSLIDSRVALVNDWADMDGAMVEDVAAEVWFSATNDDPSGNATWSGFSPLRVATDYTARAYRFELRCASSTPEHNISISSLLLSVDVDDRSESGADVVSGSGVCNVAFSRPFFAVPAIGITPHGMQTGDYYTITSKSLGGFSITFFNAAGAAVSRTFDWIARGY